MVRLIGTRTDRLCSSESVGLGFNFITSFRVLVCVPKYTQVSRRLQAPSGEKTEISHGRLKTSGVFGRMGVVGRWPTSAADQTENPMAEPQISENVPVVTEVVGDRKTSAELAINLVGQFMAIAAGGVAFIVGLLTATGFRFLLAISLLAFSATCALGMLFFMHAIFRYRHQGDFDINSSEAAQLTIWQIVALLIGLLFIGIYVFVPSTAIPDSKTIRIDSPGKQTVICPIEPGRNYTVHTVNGETNLTVTEK